MPILYSVQSRDLLYKKARFFSAVCVPCSSPNLRASMKLLILLWIFSFLHLVSGEEKCPWKPLEDLCHPLGQLQLLCLIRLRPRYCCIIAWLFRIYNCPCVRMTLVFVVLPHCTAHPDGSDIACEVEVKNCTGVPFQCKYVGSCPSNHCLADGDETMKRGRRAAAKNNSPRLWPGAVVPYVIENNYTGESGCLGRRRI